MLNNCHNGHHRLIRIFDEREDIEGLEYVVRWCEICGSVVVDVDYDGRINPGGFMKMRTPLNLNKESNAFSR